MHLQAGAEIPETELPPIAQAQLNAYAEASGDPNRIHLDESVAKSMGLPGVIAHGMLSAAFIAERAMAAVLADPALSGFRIRRFQCRFKSMVLLGDRVFVGGKVKEADPSRVVLDISARNQKGEIVTGGVAEFSAPSVPLT